MSVDPESRRLIERLLNAVPDLRAVVILVDERGQIEAGVSESMGADEQARDINTMLVCSKLAESIAEKIQPDLQRDNGVQKLPLVLPPRWNGYGRN